MGRKLSGQFLKWPKTSDVATEVQNHAVEQVIRLYKNASSRQHDPPLWGDEIEYTLVLVDEENNEAKLSLQQRDIFKQIENDQHKNRDSTSGSEQKSVRADVADYELEFSKYMIESNPGSPYGICAGDLVKVEPSMSRRREYIRSHCPQFVSPFTISLFPGLGLSDGVDDETDSDSSEPVPLDAITSDDCRHQAVHENIRLRHDSHFSFTTPLFIDKNTISSATHPHTSFTFPKISLPGAVFGPGHCGLQVTFQASSEAEVLMLHDQLIPLGPVLLALTASTPICNGYLKDNDVRWNQLVDSMDDRTASERKSIMPRCSVNSLYLASDPRLPLVYQKTDVEVNADLKQRLEAGGLPHQLATHFALAFARDPLAISESDLDACSHADSTLAFDILDGCSWPHVKLKLPSATNEALGWRVEFRAMETQVSDFENAAFCVFVALVRCVVVKYGLNFYVPIGSVQKGMQQAHKRNAVVEERFAFRAEPFGEESGEEGVREMSVDEIVNGSAEYVGLVPLIKRYMLEGKWSNEERVKVKEYLDLVGRRASGKCWTAARWMREFVMEHEDYKQDSRVSSRICFDMMREVKTMMDGEMKGRMFEWGEC